jgi:hypothetical protein
MRDSLKTSRRTHTEPMARLEAEADCFVLLTHGPTAGDRAQSARDLLTVYRDQQGTEQNAGLLQDPVIVHRLFLKKPERLEALGRIFLLALRRWRLMARAMRTYGDMTSTPVRGWDKQATERPTACMMVTTCAGVLVLQGGPDRPLARPLSVVHQQ